MSHVGSNYSALLNGWTVRADSPGIKHLTSGPVSFTANQDTNNISVEVDFNDLDPVILRFDASQAERQTFSLLDFSITNSSGEDWYAFNISSIDTYVPPGPDAYYDNPGHPFYSHFHPISTESYNIFSHRRGWNSILGENEAAAPNSWEFYGETYTDGNNSLSITDVRVHQYIFYEEPFRQLSGGNFAIILTPNKLRADYSGYYIKEDLIDAGFLSGDAPHFGNPVPRKDMLFGYAGDDVLEGRELSDMLFGGAGADTLSGGSQDDTLSGGAGADTLYGGSQVDTLSGGAGEDLLDGGSQNDTLVGGAGADSLYGGSQNDALIGGEESDSLLGESGDDYLSGGSGNDLLDGGGGSDYMAGDLGDDNYLVESFGDYVVEAADAGIDTVTSTISHTLQENFENLTLLGSDYLDAYGNAGNNRLRGNDVSNFISGLAGDDVLDGGAGGDNMIGGSGNDRFFVDSIGDSVQEAADAGNDTVYISIDWMISDYESIERLYAYNVSIGLTLTGNKLDNTIGGGAGNDVLAGGSAGKDTLIGMAGDDTYVVDHAGVATKEAATAGHDKVLSSIDHVLVANIEDLTLLGSAAIDGTGNRSANTITGNLAANILNGGDGRDIIDGGDGRDLIDGGLGKDGLTGGSGNDSFLFKTALGSRHVDHITDFSVPSDTIRLDNAIFKVLANGKLQVNQFKDIGVTGAKVDADDRVLYNNNTGALIYDPDGSGSRAAVKFATIDNQAILTYHDFLIV